MATPRTEAAPFPATGLLPKEDTQAAAFVDANPEWDGRGIVIAILDTGVDPGAIGLQTTTDGRPKVIDLVEATGSGDVAMSAATKCTEPGTLKGLSGRTLTLNPAWVNPSGEWRLGLKPGFDFFPPGLKRRWKSNASADAAFPRAEMETNARRELAEFDDAHPSPSGADATHRKELDQRVKALAGLASSWEELGPVYDVVCFFDGKHWRAALDTSETGDMSAAEALASYRVERQYVTLSAGTSLNFCLNTYDEGDVVSVVCDTGAHGSHVAGIAAGHHPDDPALNGVAPGAQIVGIKIGDTRLGSMETTAGLIRGLKAVVDNGAHLINLSYGEPTKNPNVGRFIELATRVVRRNNVIFVSSAGNAGPALSTVGAPGSTSSALVGIGAMVSPAMMRAQYSMREEVAPINYTWSSRGPAFDGDLGVCISAPGGAITCVPNWTLRKNQLMNGTSMSSPNACGNLALLLSALKAQGRPWTSYSIRRAIENTAAPVEGSDVFGLGHGLLCTADAYALLAASDTSSHGYTVTVPYGGAGAGGPEDRGVYLRDEASSSAASTFHVTVDPLFEEPVDDHADPANTTRDMRPRITFERRFELKSTAPEWVSCPSHVLMDATGKTFSIRVEPQLLEEGSGVHFAQILAFDVERPDERVAFRVPVTAVKPERIPRGAPHGSYTIATIADPLHLRPGSIERRFLTVPRGATWADIVLRRVDAGSGDACRHGSTSGAHDGTVDVADTSSRLLVLHAVQVMGMNTCHRDADTEQYFRMSPGSQGCMSTAVTDTTTLEVVVAQFWSSLGDTDVAVDVMFRGVQVEPSSIALSSGDAYCPVTVVPHLHSTAVSPSGSLKTWRRVLRPTGHVVKPLQSRDVDVAGTRKFAITLTYKFSLSQGATVTPWAHAIHRLLYESPFEAQFVIVSNASKRSVGYADANAEKLTLSAGDFTLRLEVRHHSSSLLEGFKDTALYLDQPLSSKVSLKFASTQQAAITGSGSFSRRLVKQHLALRLFMVAPKDSDLPKEAAAGDILVGSATFAKYTGGVGGQETHPDGVPVAFYVGRRVSSAGGGSGGGSGSSDAAKAAQIKAAASASADDFPALYERLAAAFPDDPEVLQVALHNKDKVWTSANTVDVAAAAGAVVASIDTDAVAAYFGTRHEAAPGEKEDGDTKKFDKLKAVLEDALFRKARAHVSHLGLRSGDSPSAGAGAGSASRVAAGAGTGAGVGAGASGASSAAAADDGFAAAMADLRRWVDVTDDKYLLLLLEEDVRATRLGTAVNRLTTMLKKGDKACGKTVGSEKLYDLRTRVVADAGWAFWQTALTQQRARVFPPSLQPM